MRSALFIQPPHVSSKGIEKKLGFFCVVFSFTAFFKQINSWCDEFPDDRLFRMWLGPVPVVVIYNAKDAEVGLKCDGWLGERGKSCPGCYFHM